MASTDSAPSLPSSNVSGSGASSSGAATHKKRAVHNASEARRAKRINQQIDLLKKLLTSAGLDFKKDKGTVLETAVEFIRDTIESRGEKPPEPATTSSERPAKPFEAPSASLSLSTGVDYRQVFLMASVPQAVASIDGTFLDANNTFCTLTGYSREEILKKSFFNLTPPQELQATFSVVSELMGRQTSGGGYATRSFKKLCRMRYGVVEVFVSMSVIKNDDDSPAYFTCAVLPVTGSGQEQAEAVGSLAHQSNSSTGSQSVASPVAGDSCSPKPHSSAPQQYSRHVAAGGAAPSALPPPSVRPFVSHPPPASAASAAVCSPGEGFCPGLINSALQQLPPQVSAPQQLGSAGSLPGRHGYGTGHHAAHSTPGSTLRMPSIASVDTEAVLAGMQHSSHQFAKARGESTAPRGAGGVSVPPAGVPVAPPNIFVAPVSSGGVTGNNSIAAFSLGMQDEDWRDEDSFLADMTFDS